MVEVAPSAPVVVVVEAPSAPVVVLVAAPSAPVVVVVLVAAPSVPVVVVVLVAAPSVLVVVVVEDSVEVLEPPPQAAREATRAKLAPAKAKFLSVIMSLIRLLQCLMMCPVTISESSEAK